MPQLRLLTIPIYDFTVDMDRAQSATMADQLCRYFRKCIVGTHFNSVVCLNGILAREVTTSDLLCYIVPDRSQSVVKKLVPDATLGPNGSTTLLPGRGTVSEIYLRLLLADADPGILAANMIFHEYGHNKLNRGLDMHVVPHVQLLSGQPIRSDWAMSFTDERLMRQGLHHPRPQYTGAIPLPGQMLRLSR